MVGWAGLFGGLADAFDDEDDDGADGGEDAAEDAEGADRQDDVLVRIHGMLQWGNGEWK